MSTLGNTMMRLPLNVSALLVHAARHAGDVEVVSKQEDGRVHRSTWAEVEQRARRLAGCWEQLGVAAGEPVATLAWNGHRHLEIYYGASGAGRVCHTVNPRLFPEQIAWIVNDAADGVLAFDVGLWPLVQSLRDRLTSVRHLVALCEPQQMPADAHGVLCYESLLAEATPLPGWPEIDEQAASSICYTSGTTGHPKGAVYSHRSTVLHAYGAALPDSFNLSAEDVLLPVVPMFHVNAWGLPYSAALVGCKLVLPGPHLDGASLHGLIEAEGVTVSAGVPTVWLGVLQHLRQQQVRFSTFRRALVGGAACPPALLAAYADEFGVELRHVWGMTELSPLGTICAPKAKHRALDAAGRRALQVRQGRVLFGLDLCVVDGDGRPLPWDGRSSGELLARGHWVIDRYLGQPAAALREVDGRGWFPTGDVATIDADGYMQITDRSKDVIKSGGEWISSIELENIAMSHPAVHEAAVVGCRHPKWDERPLLVVVRRPGATVQAEELLRHYDGRVARWQVPDEVVFVDEIPHTATGKVQKLRLRETYRDHLLAAGAKGA